MGTFGGPAFPEFGQEHIYRGEADRLGSFEFIPKAGMSLRDYFAGQALGTLTAEALRLNHSEWAATAQHAYLVADAMLAERMK